MFAVVHGDDDEMFNSVINVIGVSLHHGRRVLNIGVSPSPVINLGGQMSRTRCVYVLVVTSWQLNGEYIVRLVGR